MKTQIRLIVLFLLACMFTGCLQNKKSSAKQVLANETTQNEIMDMIVEDHDMMVNLINHIKKSNHAMQMMRIDTSMIRHMVKSNSTMMEPIMHQMMNVVKDDTILCRNMTSMMMNNEHVRRMVTSQHMQMMNYKEKE